MVERLPCKQDAGGSIPPSGSTFLTTTQIPKREREKKMTKKRMWEVVIGKFGDAPVLERKIITEHFEQAVREAERLKPKAKVELGFLKGTVEILLVKYAGEVYE